MNILFCFQCVISINSQKSFCEMWWKNTRKYIFSNSLTSQRNLKKGFMMKKSNRKNMNKKTYSPAMYRMASVGAIIGGISFLFLGLIFIFIVPLLGLLVSLFGWSCFFISNNFRKQAKEA